MAVDYVSETQEFSKPRKNIFELRGAVLTVTNSLFIDLTMQRDKTNYAGQSKQT